MPKGRKTDLESFMSLVEKTDSCWIFHGSKDKDGYGQITVNYTNMRAHRYSYLKFIGEIPNGKILLHSCDTPSCVNPNHLRIGNHKENAEDRVKRGRNRDQRGIKNNMSKLTDEQIISIYKDSRRQKDIASDYGICQQHVSDIKTGKKRVDVTKNLVYNGKTLLKKEE